ncbi:MAG: hypothetical protein EOM64_04255 [Erysipelotrichia bacterium]|nr:hypothetical protein [Erysipelotrichia bacterium]
MITAIIAILNAISIFIFSEQAKKIKTAACPANCRSLKSELISAYMKVGDRFYLSQYRSDIGYYTVWNGIVSSRTNTGDSYNVIPADDHALYGNAEDQTYKGAPLLYNKLPTPD